MDTSCYSTIVTLYLALLLQGEYCISAIEDINSSNVTNLALLENWPLVRSGLGFHHPPQKQWPIPWMAHLWLHKFVCVCVWCMCACLCGCVVCVVYRQLAFLRSSHFTSVLHDLHCDFFATRYDQILCMEVTFIGLHNSTINNWLSLFL